ncbi:hypothetical protein ACQZ6B_13290 [Agrobacterium vitis]
MPAITPRAKIHFCIQIWWVSRNGNWPTSSFRPSNQWKCQTINGWQNLQRPAFQQTDTFDRNRHIQPEPDSSQLSLLKAIFSRKPGFGFPYIA